MASHRWLVFLSIFSSSLLILSLISLSFIFYDLKSFYDESIEDIDTFTMYAERAWSEMKSSPSSSSPSSSLSPSILYGRHPRSAAICQCGPIQETPCPNGPAGDQGPDGDPGRDGDPGPDGENGNPPTAYGHPCPKPGCAKCPPGPPGNPGPDGNPGNQGSVGAPGEPGSAGYGASVGPPGPPGTIGVPGRNGEPGLDGRPGNGARSGRGLPGLPGIPGGSGNEGASGPPGKRAPDGVPGPMGPMGPMGLRGTKGRDGRAGEMGERGDIGTDAAYCPCPKRNHEYGVRSYTHGGSVNTRKRSGDVYKKKWNTARGYADDSSTVLTMSPPIRYHDQKEAIIINGGEAD